MCVCVCGHADVIDNDKRPPLPDTTHPRLARMIQSCWDGHPKRRYVVTLLLATSTKETQPLLVPFLMN